MFNKDIQYDIKERDYVETYPNSENIAYGGTVIGCLKDYNRNVVCVRVQDDYRNKKYYLSIESIYLWEQW